jgi:catalase
VAGGVEVGALRAIQQALQDAGAMSRIVSDRLGFVATSSGQQLAVDHTFATMPSVMFDAVLVPGGAASAEALSRTGDAVHFVLEAYKHCKTICVIGEGAQLLRTLGIAAGEGGPEVPGIVVGRNDPPARAQLAQEFIAAIARHRHWSRPNVDAVPA